MRTRIALAFALVAALAVGYALAGEAAKSVTVEGNMMCAHCTLHEAGLKSCQDVVVVGEGSGAQHYYLSANEISKKFGHSCQGAKAVKVTGTVTEKDGKKWLEATAIEPAKKA